MNGKDVCAFSKGIGLLQQQGYHEHEIMMIMGIEPAEKDLADSTAAAGKGRADNLAGAAGKATQQSSPPMAEADAPSSPQPAAEGGEDLPTQELPRPDFNNRTPREEGRNRPRREEAPNGPRREEAAKNPRREESHKSPRREESHKSPRREEAKRSPRSKTLRTHVPDMPVRREDYILARILLSRGSLSQEELTDIWNLWHEKYKGKRLFVMLIEAHMLSTKVSARLEQKVKRHLEKPESEATLNKLDKTFCGLAVKRGLVSSQLVTEYHKRHKDSSAAGILPVAQALINDGHLQAEYFSELKAQAETILYSWRFRSLLKGHQRHKKSTARMKGKEAPAKKGNLPPHAKLPRATIPESVIAVKAVTDIRKGKDLAQPRRRSTDPIPENFGNYKILEEVAIGGMGTVYKAVQKGLDRIVALKVLRHQEEGRDRIKRFKREADAVSRLNHPNIVRIHEIDVYKGRHFFSMDFIDGIPLDVLIKEADVEFDDLIKVAIEIAEAIHYAHMNGVIHRDLKPANIIVDMDGHPQITDFGLAKIIDAETMLTKSDTILGTPYYMAPEQTRGDTKKIGSRTDVWGLGIILYEMVTGTLPFKAQSTIELYHKINHLEPTPPKELNPSISEDLQNIILKSIEKDPAHRYPNAQALADDLKRHIEGKAIHAKRIPEWWKKTRRMLNHRKFLDIIAASLLLIVGSILLYFFWIFLEKKSSHTQLNPTSPARPTAHPNPQPHTNTANVSASNENLLLVKAYIAKAKAYAAEAVYGDALNAIKQAIDVLPPYPDAYFGQQTAKPWERQAAIQTYLERARIYQAIAASVSRTRETSRQNYLSQALEDINKTLRLAPGHTESLLVRASIYLAKKKIKDAIADYHQLIQANPTNMAAYLGRAEARVQQQDYKLALLDFEKAIELSPRDYKLRLRCAQIYMIYAQKDPAHRVQHLRWALMHLDKAIANNDLCNKSAFLALRGDIHYQLKEYRQAIEDWGAAIMANPAGNLQLQRKIRQAQEKLK